MPSTFFRDTYTGSAGNATGRASDIGSITPTADYSPGPQLTGSGDVYFNNTAQDALIYTITPPAADFDLQGTCTFGTGGAWVFTTAGRRNAGASYGGASFNISAVSGLISWSNGSGGSGSTALSVDSNLAGGGTFNWKIEYRGTTALFYTSGALRVTATGVTNAAGTSIYVSGKDLFCTIFEGIDPAGATAPVIATNGSATPTGTTRASVPVTISSGATTGTLYGLGRTGGSAASAATIKATGATLGYTSIGNKTVTGCVVAAGSATQYVDVVANDGADSNVITFGPFTTAAAVSWSTIPTINLTAGATANEALAGYASGGFGSRTYSSALATAGLSINAAGTIVGTAGGAQTITGVTITGTDSGSVASSVASSAFSIVITAPASSLSGNATAEDGTASGTIGIAPGVLTTPPLRNRAGTLLASVSGIAVNVYNASTGALVVRKTGLTSGGDGRVIVTDAALTAGATYAYEPDLTGAGYGRRLPTGTAA